MKCTKQRSHLENAIDRAFPDGKINTWTLASLWDAIYNDALDEYFNCEGDHE